MKIHNEHPTLYPSFVLIGQIFRSTIRDYGSELRRVNKYVFHYVFLSVQLFLGQVTHVRLFRTVRFFAVAFSLLSVREDWGVNAAGAKLASKHDRAFWLSYTTDTAPACAPVQHTSCTGLAHPLMFGAGAPPRVRLKRAAPHGPLRTASSVTASEQGPIVGEHCCIAMSCCTHDSIVALAHSVTTVC